MQRVGVREEDLEERFLRSRGPGGQNVNKVETCVVLRHRPSGVEIRCQRERSQAVNRYLARWLLVERLETQRAQQLCEAAQRLAALRRQKRKRPAGVQAQLLASKRHRAHTKGLRRRVRPGDED